MLVLSPPPPPLISEGYTLVITGGLQGIGLCSLIIRWLNQQSILAMHLNWKWPFCNIGAWFDQIFRQIVPMTEKTLKNTNLVVSRHIKRENASLPVDVRRYYLLHRHFTTGDEAQGTMGRKKMRGDTRLACFVLPAFLCAQI